MPNYTIIGIVFAFFIAFAIITSILRANWNRLYFTVGLPLFIYRVPMKSLSSSGLDISKMESEFPPSFMQNALVFKQLDSNLYAIRGEASGRNNGDPIHGTILFDQTEQQVVVKGYSNVTDLIGFLAVIYVGSFYIQWWIISLTLIPIGVLYFIQIKRFRKVAEKAAELTAIPPQSF